MRFAAGETLAEAITRTAREQFDIALRIATTTGDERSLAVHATRKALKRLRALLRLVRGPISPEVYRTDNEAMKLVAAELSRIRDMWVMAETLSRIVPRSPEIAPDLPALMGRLQTSYYVESQAVLGNEALMGSIIEQLTTAQERSARWAVSAEAQTDPLPHSFSSIAAGLERIYKQGRRGMTNAAESPTDTLLHVWRKRAKYLRHQIEALNVLDPLNLQALEDHLAQLTDHLGDDHDLAVLTGRLEADPSLIEGIEIEPILSLIGEHRHELQEQAHQLGSAIYADASAAFLERMSRLWPPDDTF